MIRLRWGSRALHENAWVVICDARRHLTELGGRGERGHPVEAQVLRQISVFRRADGDIRRSSIGGELEAILCSSDRKLKAVLHREAAIS